MMVIPMLPSSVRYLREPGQPEPDGQPNYGPYPRPNHPPRSPLKRSIKRRAILAVVAEIEREDAARKASQTGNKQQ